MLLCVICTSQANGKALEAAKPSEAIAVDPAKGATATVAVVSEDKRTTQVRHSVLGTVVAPPPAKPFDPDSLIWCVLRDAHKVVCARNCAELCD